MAFTTAQFSGSYGLNASQAVNGHIFAQPAIVIGSVTATPVNNTDAIAGFADSANGRSDYVVNGSLSTGTSGVLSGTLTGLDSASRSTTDTFTVYIVDTTRTIVIETDSTESTLGYLQLQQ